MQLETGRNSELVLGALSEGKTQEDIKALLLETGLEERYANDLIKEVTKLYRAKRTAKGITLMSVGATVCFVSCITSLLFFSQSSFTWTLYGLTSAGILILFAGLVRVF